MSNVFVSGLNNSLGTNEDGRICEKKSISIDFSGYIIVVLKKSINGS